MRNSNIDALRGLFIIGVVLHHVANRRLDSDVVDYISGLVSIIPWAVFGFIFVSALITARGNYFLVIKSRVKRLLVPYFVLGLLYAFLWSGVEYVRGSGWSASYAIRLLSCNHPIGEQLYFLPLLFVVSVPFLLVESVKGWDGVVLVVAFALTLALSVKVIMGGITLGFGLVWMNILIGAWVYSLGGAYRVLSLIYSARVMDLIVLFFGCVVLIVYFFTKSVPYASVFIPLGLYHVLGMGWARIGLVKWIVGSFAWLGLHSSAIFAFHTPFIIYPIMGFLAVLNLNSWFVVFLSMIGSIGASILLGKVLSGRRYSYVLMV